MNLVEMMLEWHNSAYGDIINSITLLILILLFRSFCIKITKKILVKRNLLETDLFPFIKSIINWLTFYSVLFFVIHYFGDDAWLVRKLFEIGGTPITLLNIIIAIIIITLGFRISQFIARFVLGPTLKRYELEPGLQYTLTRVSHYVIVILAVLISVMNIGIDLSALTVFLSVLGVGIGFGLQNITSNFISGIILLFERPIKVGDTVKLDDIVCIVEEIKIRATVVRTFDNERIIIPNSNFVENKIINWSYGEESMRVVLNIGVDYGSDVHLMKKLLLQAAHEQPNILQNPAPHVDFLNFGNSSLDFRLVVWVPSSDFLIAVRSDINFRINDLFKEYGIEIPYPQQDLHLRSIDPEIVELFTASKNRATDS